MGLGSGTLEMGDLPIPAGIQDGDTLTFDASGKRWTHAQPSSGGLISQLSTVTLNYQLAAVAPGSRANDVSNMVITAAGLDTPTDSVDLSPFIGTAHVISDDYEFFDADSVDLGIRTVGLYRVYAQAGFTADTTGLRAVKVRDGSSTVALGFDAAPPIGTPSPSPDTYDFSGIFAVSEAELEMALVLQMGHNASVPLDCTGLLHISKLL